MPKKLTKKEEDKILEEFEKDFEIGDDLWRDTHERYTAEKKFTLQGKQWDETEYKNRLNSTPPRPTLVLNKSLPHILEVTNDIKKMKPGIKVRPVGEEDTELAEVRQGLIRSIEKDSNGSVVYNEALVDCVAAGVGFWRIKNEFLNEKSFKQVLKLEVIDDATSVRTGDWKKPDSSDKEFSIITDDMSPAEFKAEFDKDPDDYVNRDTHKAWGNEHKVYIHEYWKVRFKDDELCGRVESEENEYLSVLQKEADEMDVDVDSLIAVDKDGEQVRRDTTRPEVYWYKVAAKKVLKHKRWPGKWIPLVMLKARLVRLEGEFSMHSLTHAMKDAQTSYNFARSAQVERAAMIPKNHWMYPIGSIPRSEQSKYKTSNTRNWWGLGYNQFDEKGRSYDVPARSQPVNVDPAFSQEVTLASEDIKAVSGQFDPSMGAGGQERSGVAIEALKRSGNTSTYDFPYELGIGIRFSGMILNDLIPHTYDTEQQVTIIGDDDAEKVIWVNKEVSAQEDTYKQKGYNYDLKKGDFNLEVEMGLSQATKRQETLMGLEALFKSNPAFSELLGDLYVKEQDWRFSDIAAKRIRKHLNKTMPGLTEGEGDEDEGPTAQEQAFQQELEQMQQMMQELQAENEQLKEGKEIEAMKVEGDLDVKEEKNDIAMAEAESKNEIEKEKLDLERLKIEKGAAFDADKIELEKEKIELEKAKVELEREKLQALKSDKSESKSEESSKQSNGSRSKD